MGYFCLGFDTEICKMCSISRPNSTYPHITHLISPHLIREGVPHDIDGRTSRPVTPKMTSSVDEPILIPIFSFE